MRLVLDASAALEVVLERGRAGDFMRREDAAILTMDQALRKEAERHGVQVI